ncbi:MAG: CoA transferase [Alphaproteobacteria bacterium]|nr:CoA transferase [Alphaproteobacteria bacterium]
MQNKSLNNIKVLDLSRYIAGPFCGQIFGDLGADVVKVERADGGEEGAGSADGRRRDVVLHGGRDRNKRSLTLDFRNPDGQALLRRLAAKAIILIENFRPGTLEDGLRLRCPVGGKSGAHPRAHFRLRSGRADGLHPVLMAPPRLLAAS